MPVKRRSKVKFSAKAVRREIRRRNPDHWENSSSSGRSSISNFSMDSAGGSSTQPSQGAINNEAKKRKLHEAQLIPGLQPGKIYGFPNTIISKHRYSSVINLVSTTGALAKHVFASNSMFDPDITGSGHQPLYFDNYASIYDQYVVIGSKITVMYMPRSSTLHAIGGLIGDDDGTTPTTFDTLCESNNAISTVIAPAGGGITELEMTFEPQENFGVDAKSDGSAQTAVTTSPTEQWYWTVWHQPADGASTQTCDVKVMIEYTVKYSELKSQVQN